MYTLIIDIFSMVKRGAVADCTGVYSFTFGLVICFPMNLHELSKYGGLNN